MKGAGGLGQRYATAMDRQTGGDMIGMWQDAIDSQGSQRIVYSRWRDDDDDGDMRNIVYTNTIYGQYNVMTIIMT